MKRLMLFALLLCGCKQGVGERCQVAADCQDNLVCSAATGLCEEMTTGGIDAQVPDAGPKMDAAVGSDAATPDDAVPSG